MFPDDLSVFYDYDAKDLMNQDISFWLKEREGAGIKYLNDPKAFIEFLAYMDDV